VRTLKAPGTLPLFALLFLFLVSVLATTTYAQESQESAEGKIIKEIRFEGLKRTKEYIVTRELLSAVGEPLRQENLDKETQRFERLDIFSDIRIDAKVDAGEVILTYIFVETFAILWVTPWNTIIVNGIIS